MLLLIKDFVFNHFQSTYKDVLLNLVSPPQTDIQCPFGCCKHRPQELVCSGKFCQTCAWWMDRCSFMCVLTSFLPSFIYIFLFALSLTKMLLQVRAQECCFEQFEVSFQVKLILLCIQFCLMPLIREYRFSFFFFKHKTLMPIAVDCRLDVDAWLNLLAPCLSANLPCRHL